MKIKEFEINFIKYKYIKNSSITNKYNHIIFYKWITISMSEFCRNQETVNKISFTEYFFLFIKKKLDDFEKENIFFNELFYYLKTIENIEEKKILKLIFTYFIDKKIINFLWSLRFRILFVLDIYKSELFTPFELININEIKLEYLLKNLKEDLNNDFEKIRKKILKKTEIKINNKRLYRLSTLFYILFYKYYLKNINLIDKNKTKLTGNINNFVASTIDRLNIKDRNELNNKVLLKNVKEINEPEINFTYVRNNRRTF